MDIGYNFTVLVHITPTKTMKLRPTPFFNGRLSYLNEITENRRQREPLAVKPPKKNQRVDFTCL